MPLASRPTWDCASPGRTKLVRPVADSSPVAEPKERDPLAVAFGEVVSRRLEALGRGAKSRLGKHLGAIGAEAAGSVAYEILKVQKHLPHRFSEVAEFLGVKRSELLQEIVDWLREQGL